MRMRRDPTPTTMAGRLAGARALDYLQVVPMALRAAQMPAHGAYGGWQGKSSIHPGGC